MNDDREKYAKSTLRTVVERPHLLSYNRKLRHLRGISLRGLNIDPWQRQHGLSTLTTVTSAGLSVKNDGDAQHSCHPKDHGPSTVEPTTDNSELSEPRLSEYSDTAATISNQQKSRRRRRSTLDFNASARQRQQRLDDTISYHLVDAFFSLHVSLLKDPIYISEQIESTMNPDFQLFDFSMIDTRISQSEMVTVKLWVKQQGDSNWKFLEEAAVFLPALHFIGKSIEQDGHPFPENSIIFHLSDGVYITPEDHFPPPISRVLLAPLSSNHLQTSTVRTSSYDALMRLQTLHECIQDAVQTRINLTNDINDLIKNSEASGPTSGEVVGARDSSTAASRSISTVRRNNKALSAQVATLHDSLEGRRTKMKECLLAQNDGQRDLESVQAKLVSFQAAHKDVLHEIAGQRRRICTDLTRIYPLEPAPEKPLLFTIRALPLSNSVYPAPGMKDEIISAALGHVACLVQLLAHYLSIPLPYPIEPRASTSRIKDPVSLMAGSRTFPLYVGRSSSLFRFEYGVFLLNKDIELLSVRLGINVLDIRQTLPNLKFLFFVATAGKGNLPMRKAGGIRGLVGRTDSYEGTPSSSRRGSDENMADDVALRERLRQRVNDFANDSGTKNRPQLQRGASGDLSTENDDYATYTPHVLSSLSDSENWRIGSTMSMQS